MPPEQSFQPQFQPTQTPSPTDAPQSVPQFEQQFQPIQSSPSAGQGSSVLKIFIAITFVLLSTGSVFGFWKYQEMKKLLADNLAKTEAVSIVATTTNESTSTDLTVASSSIVSVATSTPQPIVNQVKTATTVSVSKPIVNNVKTETDKYGVDLYILKQGSTKITKKIDGKSVNVTYTRTNNSVKRDVQDADGWTTSVTIDLDMKDKLPTKIKEMENDFVTQCKDTPTDKECLDFKGVIDYIKANCVNLKTNEETGYCVTSGIMGASPFPDKIQVNIGTAK